MQRDKRSFLERLTGSISIADEETPVERSKINIQSDKTESWVEEEAEDGELSVDVYQTASEIVIQTMVAGVKPEDLNISITREMVTIQGRRDRPTEVDESDYFQKELYWGSFSRTILLPSEVETEEAEAIEKHGLLTLRLPKIDKAKVQKIRVKSI